MTQDLLASLSVSTVKNDFPILNFRLACVIDVGNFGLACVIAVGNFQYRHQVS
jgi:hypothetical protein